jgi:hypothetical protein
MFTELHHPFFQSEISTGVARNLAKSAELAGSFDDGALFNDHSGPIRLRYGKCSKCSCPGFYGSGYTCSRGGCGHHYDSHW